MEPPMQSRNVLPLKPIIFGMMASHFVYAAVGLAIVTRGRFELSDMRPVADLGAMAETIFLIMAGCAFVMLVLAVLVPKILFSSESSGRTTAAESGKIFQHAFVEAAGVLGFVALLLTGWAVSLLFNLVSLVFHIVFFPYHPDETGEDDF